MPPLCVSPVAVSVSVSVTESQSPPMPMLRPCCYGGSSADRDGSLPADADTTVWSVADAAELYRVDGWGAPYFAVNDFGNVFVRPHGDGTLPSQEIDLTKVVRKVVSGKSSGGLGMRAPFIVRFPDILRHRLESLQAAFDSAMALLGYEARYQGVYPVKCNQDRYVVENVVEFGAAHDFGLEAGSKPELLLAMASMCKASSPKALLICNGYKDAEYITLALTARRLGFNCVIVLEQDEELELVLDVARRLRVEPVIGVRAKLRTRHGGHFGGTSGENGKFGLTTAQIVGVVRRLKHAGMVNCLQLLHFHIGSQIPTVELLADGVTEAAFIYCELVRMGAAMNILDIGGGLGIDYDGTRSASSDMSVAYTLDEYAAAVVGAVQAACRHRGVESPVICSESGRALVSHHSVLLFDVVSLSEHGVEIPSPEEALADLPAELLDDYRTVVGFAGIGEYGQSRALAEKLKLRCVERFKEGELGLEQLALVDCINELLTNSPVRAVCQINLSIFKSLPDWWAIGQMFPLMPIQRLNERPTVRAVLSDLTCDSDGKLSRFIDGEDGLAVHRLNRRGGEPYYIGMFLGGAYQEALGGSHNLFGSPSVVHVLESEGPHGFAVTRALPGQTAADVLRLMMHEPHLMFQTLKCRIESSILGSSNRDSDSWSYATALSSLDSIAAAFDSLPYLSSSSSSASTSDGDDEESDYPDALDFNLDLLW